MKTGFQITVDNSVARSHNVNIDYPTFFVYATNEAEAIGLMMLSDFEYKNNPVHSIEQY